MLQQLFTDTIESRFIKQLLYQTPMPILDTCTDDTYIVKGCYYIYKYFIIRCDKSGRISKDAEITKISPFTFGVLEPGISYRYRSKNRYYDSDDHKQLGKYLRCVRDIYSIDLMPFYNCFNNQLINDIVLTSNGYEIESNSGYKVLATPIKYNTTYTIAVDCAEEILIRPIVYTGVGIDKKSQTELDKVVETTQRRNMSRFKKPFTYSINTADSSIGESTLKYLKDRERDLYLLVQLPKNNTSSFVILEGDYTSVDAYKVFSSYDNEDEPNNISSQTLNTYLLSSLSLLRINDRNIYAFSDALIEYLLMNAITSQENISQNILRVQNSLYPLVTQESKRTSVWTDELRKSIYRTYMDSVGMTPIEKTGTSVEKYFGEAIDINGFVGKRVEDMLSSLKYTDKVDGK